MATRNTAAAPAASTAPADDGADVEKHTCTWIPEGKVKGNETVIEVTGKTKLIAGVTMAEVLVKA